MPNNFETTAAPPPPSQITPGSVPTPSFLQRFQMNWQTYSKAYTLGLTGLNAIGWQLTAAYMNAPTTAARAQIWNSPLAKLGRFLNMPLVRNVIGGVSLGLGAIGTFQGVQDMFKNGFSLRRGLNLGMNVYGVAMGASTIFYGVGGGVFHGLLPNPAAWPIAGAVVAGAVTYGSITSMIIDGVTPGKVITAAAGTIGTVVMTNLALKAAAFGGPVGWIAAGGLVAFSVIWGLFHKKSAEEKAAEALNEQLTPIIWTAGPLLTVAVGTTALLMGWGRSTPPIQAQITVPASFVTRAIGNIPVGKDSAPTVLVEKGTGDTPTRVTIVSSQGADSRGTPLLKMQSYNLSKNLEFVSTKSDPGKGYIPFFIYVKGKAQVNPDVVQALMRQEKLLESVLRGNLDTFESINAVNIALASNKYGVDIANY